MPDKKEFGKEFRKEMARLYIFLCLFVLVVFLHVRAVFWVVATFGYGWSLFFAAMASLAITAYFFLKRQGEFS